MVNGIILSISFDSTSVNFELLSLKLTRSIHPNNQNLVYHMVYSHHIPQREHLQN